MIQFLGVLTMFYTWALRYRGIGGKLLPIACPDFHVYIQSFIFTCLLCASLYCLAFCKLLRENTIHTHAHRCTCTKYRSEGEILCALRAITKLIPSLSVSSVQSSKSLCCPFILG